MNKLKVLSLFSGIGAFEKALTNIGVAHDIVGFSEIDKWAIESYCAIHGENLFNPVLDLNYLNLGDIQKIKEEYLPTADLITYGFPCQDISIAGEGAGIDKGTRSGLLYEAEKIINHIKPKYAIAENVKNLIGKRHKVDFEKLLKRLDSYGYNNYWSVLNAKNFGIPQNRERVFIVSIRKDIDVGKFEFPDNSDDEARLKDFLVDDVEDKYYIESSLTEPLNQKDVVGNEINQLGMLDIKGNEQVRRVYGVDGISPTLNTMQGGNREPKILEPVVVASRGRYVKGSSGETKQNLELNNTGNTNTITTVQKDNWVIEPCEENVYRIRKLTPLECWRLMGFDNEDYWIARRRLEKVFYNGGDRSNSQMYKQAGNSIVVDVLEEIFKKLLL